MAHGLLKKPLDFDGNLDCVMLGLWLRLGGGTTILRMGGYVLSGACLMVTIEGLRERTE